MDLREEFNFLHKLGLTVTLFGKDLKKSHRGSDRSIFVVVTRPDGDKLHYRDTLPEEDLNRLKNWIRCGDPTGLTAEWREVCAGPNEWKTWKVYLAGENPSIDCSSVMDEMFVVDEGGENHTYTLVGVRAIKVAHPEDQIGLREHSGKLSIGAKNSSIPGGLSPAEEEVYKILLGAPRADHGKVPRVVVITDLAKDYDDSAAMVVLKELHRFGFVHLEAFIANFEPQRKRAIYGRAALDSLGLQDVPIGVGTKASTNGHEEYPYEFDAPFMPDEKTFTPNKDNFFENGFELLDRVFQKGQKVVLLLISSLSDIAEYTDAHLETFQDTVERIYMQGGYSISAEGIPTPRKDAANNTFDWPAAERFHPRLKNIPSDVYTKVAAYATNIPASIFNDLGDTKHPIGKDLQNRYQRQGVQFYKTACGPKPVNGITQEKFLHNLSSFYEKHPPRKQTSEKGTPLPEDGTPLPDPNKDEIIPYLTKGLMYDALPALATGGDNLIAALGVLDTESMANQTSIHKVIGTPKQDDLLANPNIHPERMAFVISTILKGGLYDSVQNSPGSQLE